MEIADGEATPTCNFLRTTVTSDDIITEQIDTPIPDSPVTIVTGTHPPDGIQYVAYSGQSQNIEEATPTIIRRSSRKRNAVSNEDTVAMEMRTKHICTT